MARKAKGQAVAAKVPEEHVETLIVFRLSATDREQTKTIEQCIDAKAPTPTKARFQHQEIKRRTGVGCAHGFGSLGVAMGCFSDAELHRLQGHKSVAFVLPNRRCFAINSGTAGGATGALSSGTPGGSTGARSSGTPWASTGARHTGCPAGSTGVAHMRAAPPNMESYIRGFRDCADSILAGAGAVMPGAPAPHPVADCKMTADLGNWGLGAMNIYAARDAGITGKDQLVAVLDTGLDFEHPDFKNRNPEIKRRCFVPGSAVDDAQDDHGHGTHCCGTVAGAPLYGVAPDAQLVVGKVLDQHGSGWDSQIIDGINWAAEEGARIVSLSLGSEVDAPGEYSHAYEIIARRLLRHGVLIVAAAGNESRREIGHIAPVGNPAACPSIMGVAAVDAQLQLAYFSCAGRDVDVAAPGVEIMSSRLGGGTTTMSGTSMACPHVAGLAALVRQQLQHARGEDITGFELWHELEMRSLYLPYSSDDVGYGLARWSRDYLR